MSANANLTIWMRLRNAREVIAGLRETSVATQVLGSSVDRLARHLDRAGRRTFFLNQMMFTLRRYSYMVTLGLTASAAAVVKWGFDFNNNMQVARVAFAQFGLTATQAQQEVNFLFNKIAAPSPFLLQDVALAARRLMAFGMSVTQTNQTLVGITDALSAFGVTSGSSLSRATLALGHMMLIGKATGQILFQLNRDNIPMTAALKTELGLTADQLAHISALGIPAGVAIQALNKYLHDTPRFQGAALRFSLSTWQGIISTTKDYIAQFMGNIEKPLFIHLQKGVTRFLVWLQSGPIQAAARRGDIGAIMFAINPWVGRLWEQLALTFHSVARIFTDALVPAFMLVAKIAVPILLVGLWDLSHIMQFLSHHTLILKLFFGLLAAELAIMAIRMIFLLPIQIALTAAELAGAAALRILNILGIIRIATIDRETGAEVLNTESKYKNVLASTKLVRMLKLDVFWRNMSTKASRIWMAVSKGFVVGANGQFTKLSNLEKMIIRVRKATIAWFVVLRTQAATAFATLYLAMGPVGWIILGITAVVAGLAILYWRWGRFHDAVNNLASFIWRNKDRVAIAIAAMFAPILVVYEVLKRIHSIWSKITGAVHFVFGGGGGSGSPLANPGGSLPLLHQGGSVNATGSSILSPGKAVSKIGTADLGMQSGLNNVSFYGKTELNVDGRKMAEVVSHHRLDGAARR